MLLQRFHRKHHSTNCPFNCVHQMLRMMPKPLRLSCVPIILQSCTGAPCSTGFSLSNFGHRVKPFRVSGLLTRRIDGCRCPAWICTNRIRIGRSRSEALRNCTGFSDPVSAAVCPCTVLGFPASPALPASALVSRAKAEPRSHLLLHCHKLAPAVPHIRPGLSSD